MPSNDLVQLIVLAIAILLVTPPLGAYIAKVMEGERTFLSPVLLPVERVTYRLLGVDPGKEQGWKSYTVSMLLFSLVCIVGMYLMLRLQDVLPLNPSNVPAMSPDLAFNTAVSFDTNTNWQNYSGETSASQLIQMAGLAVRNFVSAAVGLAVAIALVRGLVRRTASTIGNFWADVTRCTLYLLLPISVLGAIFLVWQGVPQTFDGTHVVTTLQGATQTIPLGPIASQEIDQGAGHQWRRLLQRQLGPSVRESQWPHQLRGAVRDPGHPVRAHRDLRLVCQGPAPGMDPLRGHGRGAARRRHRHHGR